MMKAKDARIFWSEAPRRLIILDRGSPDHLLYPYCGGACYLWWEGLCDEDGGLSAVTGAAMHLLETYGFTLEEVNGEFSKIDAWRTAQHWVTRRDYQH